MDSVDKAEEKINPKVWAGWFYLFTGSVLSVFSILHFIAIFDDNFVLLDVLNVPGDVVGGSVILVGSLLFLVGGYRVLSGTEGGKAYAMVGWMTVSLLSSVSLLVLLSHLFSADVLHVPDLEGWKPLSDIVPALYLGVIPLAISPYFLRGSGKRRNRDREGGERN